MSTLTTPLQTSTRCMSTRHALASDDPFAFKKGDPKEFRETFQNLLYIHGIEGAIVTVER